MITTTSSSPEGGRMLHLYRCILRRYLGAAILYFLLQLLFFPIQYVLTAADALQTIAREGPQAELSAFLGSGGIYNAVSYPAMLVLMSLLPIFFPLAQMSYLHRRKSADLYHALPIRRERLLLINFAASATMIFAPLLISFLLVLAAGLAFGLPCFSVSGLLFELLISASGALGILALSYLTSVLAGTVLDNLAYIAAALFGLPLALYAAYSSAERLLFGFSDPPGLRRFIALLSPATCPIYAYIESPARFAAGRPGFIALLIAATGWIAGSGPILWLAARLYRHRPSELGGQTGLHNGFIFFYKLLGALFGGLCLSMLFSSVANLDSLLISLPAAFAGGALTYCLLESLLARGFKTLRASARAAALGALLPAGLLLILTTGGLGYESRIPAADAIESVTLTGFQDRYAFARYDLAAMRGEFADKGEQALKNRSFRYLDTLTLRQPEAVALIRSLHKAAVENQDSGASPGRYSSLKLCYQLKNGRKLSRDYPTLPQQTDALYDQINALEEARRQLHPIFTYGPADIREITLMNRLMANLTPLSLPQEDTGRLMEALRADLLEEPFEEMGSPQVIGYICLTPQLDSRYWQRQLRSRSFRLPEGDVGFDDCYIALTPRYARTLSLLQQLGYGGFDAVDFSAIRSACIRLDGYYGAILSLSGPQNFSQAACAEMNEDALFSRPSYETELRDPAMIQKLCGLIRYNPAQSAEWLPIDEQQEPLEHYWFNSCALYLTLTGENSFVASFCIRPSDLPPEILETMRGRFSHVWSEELFDWVLERLRDPAALTAGQAEPAAGKRFLTLRF